ncbi:hypothetical protein [Azotobacter armeniacus]
MKPTMLAASVLVLGLAAQAVAGSQPSSGFDVLPVGISPGALPGMPSFDPDGEPLWAAGGEDAGGPALQRFADLAEPGQEAVAERPALSGGIDREPSSTLLQAIYTSTSGGQASLIWSQGHRQLSDDRADFERGIVAARPTFFF